MKSILILQIIVLFLLPRLIIFFVLKKGFFNAPFETETFKNNSTVWIEKLASDRFKIEANALQSFWICWKLMFKFRRKNRKIIKK